MAQAKRAVAASVPWLDAVLWNRRPMSRSADSQGPQPARDTKPTPRPASGRSCARRLGGWKWRRQVPVGPYFADFLCLEAALIVELDGGQRSETRAYDAQAASGVP